MEIIFRGQHLTVSDDFRKYAGDHLNKLTRYLPLADHAIVDVRREAKGEQGRYVVQVTVSANGTFLRAEERSFELRGGDRSWRPTLSPGRSSASRKRSFSAASAASTKDERLPIPTPRSGRRRRYLLTPSWSWAASSGSSASRWNR